MVGGGRMPAEKRPAVGVGTQQHSTCRRRLGVAPHRLRPDRPSTLLGRVDGRWLRRRWLELSADRLTWPVPGLSGLHHVSAQSRREIVHRRDFPEISADYGRTQPAFELSKKPSSGESPMA